MGYGVNKFEQVQDGWVQRAGYHVCKGDQDQKGSPE